VNNPSSRTAFNNLSKVMGPENAAKLAYAMHRSSMLEILTILQGVFGVAEGACTSATGYCYYEMGMIKLQMADTNKNQMLIQSSSDFTDLMIDTENGHLATQMNSLSAIMNNMKTTLYRQQQHITHYMG